jgi:NitT/TauT family transport system substrate-binding protein
MGGSAAALLGLAGGGALLSGCGGGGAASSSGGKTAVTFLTILPLENLTFTPEMVASAGGHFADEGLDVTFEATQGSAPAIQTVLAGGSFLTRIDQMESMVATANKGAPLRCIGSAMRASSIRWVSAGADPIAEPEDFRGKTIGVPSEGGSSEWTLDLVLRTAGIDPEEVPRQVVGLTPGTYGLIEKGRVAAYAVGLDTALLVKKQHPDAVIFDPGTVLDAGAQIYVTTAPGLDENRDVLERYLRAIRAAMRSVLADESGEKTLKLLKDNFAVGALDDPQVAKDSLRGYAELWQGDLGPDKLLHTPAEPWQAAYDELTATGLVKKGKDPSQWYTNTLLPNNA